MDITPEQIRWILIRLLVLIVSVAVHEFGHAIMADRLGDDTPRRQGRVTLNPIAHIDPIGTLLLPVLGGIHGAASGGGGGFGWGKPVQWQPSRIRRGIMMSTATILVAVAGPLMNVVLAVLVAVTHVILTKEGIMAPTSQLHAILNFIVGTNFILFFFNLLPVPPLDGGHVLQSFMPYRHRAAFENYARFGPFVVMAFAFIPTLQQAFVIPASWCTDHLYRLLGM
jgi:Zn-dependent protease